MLGALPKLMEAITKWEGCKFRHSKLPSTCLHADMFYLADPYVPHIQLYILLYPSSSTPSLKPLHIYHHLPQLAPKSKQRKERTKPKDTI